MSDFEFAEERDYAPSKYDRNGGTGVIAKSVGVLLCLTVFFLPTGISVFRGRANTLAILLVNLFGGLFCIGWFVALVWAVTEDRDRR